MGAIRGNSEKSGTPPPPGALGNTETPPPPGGPIGVTHEQGEEKGKVLQRGTEILSVGKKGVRKGCVKTGRRYTEHSFTI